MPPPAWDPERRETLEEHLLVTGEPDGALLAYLVNSGRRKSELALTPVGAERRSRWPR
jgi:hypothetical protein